MSYTITYVEDKNIVRLDFKDNESNDPLVHQKAREEVILVCEKHMTAKVLVSMPGYDEMMGSDSDQLYDFGATFTHSRIPPHTQIAVVRSKLNIDVSFIGAAARTHGVQFKEFDSDEKAIRWLAT